MVRYGNRRFFANLMAITCKCTTTWFAGSSARSGDLARLGGKTQSSQFHGQPSELSGIPPCVSLESQVVFCFACAHSLFFLANARASGDPTCYRCSHLCEAFWRLWFGQLRKSFVCLHLFALSPSWSLIIDVPLALSILCWESSFVRLLSLWSFTENM